MSKFSYLRQFNAVNIGGHRVGIKGSAPGAMKRTMANGLIQIRKAHAQYITACTRREHKSAQQGHLEAEHSHHGRVLGTSRIQEVAEFINPGFSSRAATRHRLTSGRGDEKGTTLRQTERRVVVIDNGQGW